MNDELDYDNTQEYLGKLCDAMKIVLIEKNKRYGNSALEPVKIFSKLPAQDSIKIRLDDKLKRIQNSDKIRTNDACDCIGYLFLLLASMKVDPQHIIRLID